MLIHAQPMAIAPIHAAFRQDWPGAETHDLLDTSLASDLAAAGGILGQDIMDRFAFLSRYALDSAPEGRRTAGILFTCSAFGPAIDAARAQCPVPVLKPNETAFREAIQAGGAIALLATFEPALKPLLVELRALRDELKMDVDISGRAIDGALAALQDGDSGRHDDLIAEAAAGAAADTIILGQFTMARAADAVRARAPGKRVLTTPQSAVVGLRDLVTRAGGRTGD